MRMLLIAAALAALGANATAQPAPLEPAPPPEQIPGAPPPGAHDRHGPGPGAEHAPRLFISPSGEPFRGGDGLAAWFAQADLNHDGAITADEFQADALRFFKSLDANGDGVLDGFEIQAYEQQVPEMGQIMVDDGPRRGRHGKKGPSVQPWAGRDGAARFSLLNEPEPVLAADADVNGKVSRAEWLQATARRFEKLDRDKTGRLTLEELRAKPPKK